MDLPIVVRLPIDSRTSALARFVRTDGLEVGSQWEPDVESVQTVLVTEPENDEPALVARILAKSGWAAFERAVQDAVAAGEAGERALADALPRLGRERQVVVAAELGDTGGHAGNEALRDAVLTGAVSQDLQCAALLALAKRRGTAATADLLASLASRSGAVKSYAVIGLAHVGDDSAWEPMFHRLEQLLDHHGVLGLHPAKWSTPSVT